jgi:osmotically inducible protein OsmC
MAAQRKARATWDGNLAEGRGEATMASGACGPLEVTWRVRTGEDGADATSPEELIAAAHASCFSMAFSDGLAQAGATASHVETDATCTFEKVGEGFQITRMALRVRGTVEGVDEAGFQDAAEQAKAGCPVSQALQGNVEITLDASLG